VLLTIVFKKPSTASREKKEAIRLTSGHSPGKESIPTLCEVEARRSALASGGPGLYQRLRSGSPKKGVLAIVSKKPAEKRMAWANPGKKGKREQPVEGRKGSFPYLLAKRGGRESVPLRGGKTQAEA